MCCWLGVSA
ncbi:hypothetical protein E2C01_071006 [Portunus trituberculatus]|uniref:Uncharacterized protein n=1 Tax=Portunus trituberculatus TaxID=210409 RepID=A0A5B7I424_PORTR|nr:hypothetical protein [Portunus trituberculatus]